MSNTTVLTREQAISRRIWYIIDAKDLILGRLSVVIANILRGKNKADFTPNQDCGDFVVVINSKQIRLTGNKAKNERWYRHSGFPGGIKSRDGNEMIENHSQKLIHDAVRCMLPKNKTLSKELLKKLKIYIDAEHKHSSQKLINYEIK